MSESAVVQLRALRAAIASGQIAPYDWDQEIDDYDLFATLYGAIGVACQLDRGNVLAGLDRLIGETEAQP